jgi:hypothetical protein
VDEEQAPWWTRPPEPSPSPGAPSESDVASAETPTGELAFDDIPRRNDLVPPVTPLPPLRRSEIVAESTAVIPPPETPLAAATTITLPPDGLSLSRTPPEVTNEITSPAPTSPPSLHGLTREAPARTSMARRPPARTVLVAALAVLAVLAVIGVVRWAAGGSDADGGSSAVGATKTSGAPDPKIAASFGGVAPGDLTSLTDEEAQRLLDEHGHGDAGSVVEAYSWSDANGQNLAATTSQDADAKVDLQVFHLAGLDSDAKTLRVMRDPGLPDCDGKGTASFTRGSLLVRDLDKNDVAEVAVGWTTKCAGDTKSLAKLALITGGQKYILRGEGEIGTPGSGSPAPEPAASSWPKEYQPALVRLFRQLYY